MRLAPIDEPTSFTTTEFAVFSSSSTISARQRRDVDGRIGERQDRNGDGARIDRREVALQVHDDVMLAVGIRLSTASCTPVGAGRWSDRVITARPPAASTAAAISALSVATSTGPTAASIALPNVNDHRLR